MPEKVTQVTFSPQWWVARWWRELLHSGKTPWSRNRNVTWFSLVISYKFYRDDQSAVYMPYFANTSAKFFILPTCFEHIELLSLRVALDFNTMPRSGSLNISRNAAITCRWTISFIFLFRITWVIMPLYYLIVAFLIRTQNYSYFYPIWSMTLLLF